MKRTLCAMLAMTLATANLLAGCSMVPGATTARPFTLSYATNASNVDFFLNNDDFDTIAMSGPFYPGSRQLPSQNTGAFDAARAKRVAATVAEAQKVVDGLDAVQPKMAAVRTAYVTWLEVISTQEPKASDFVKQTLNDVALLGTKEMLGEAEYRGLTGQKATKAFATSMQQTLAVSKATELAGLYLQEANDIAAYAALGLQAFASSTDPKITSANAELDKAMGTRLDDALKGLEPVAESVGVIDLGMKGLAAGDYLFAKAGSEWTAAEMAKLKPVVDGLQVRDGITAQDVADIKAYYRAFDEWKVSLDEHFAAMDASGITQAARPGGGTWTWGPELAWAADAGSTPDASYNQAVSTVNSDPAPKPGWLASGWGLVKSGFGKAKTVVGVGVDTLGSGVRTISAVGCGIWYGNSTKDIADNSAEGVKQVFDNYKNGTSGSSTIKTAATYIEGVETGAGQAAGSAAKWATEGVFGKGKVSAGAGWVADGLVKNTVGMFTGMAKGIYKVADKGSSTADVAGGFVDIALGAIAGSKVIIQGSQIPGMLKSGFTGFKNAGTAILSLADSAANKVASGKLEAEIAKLMVAKGLTAAEAKNLVSNQVKLEVRAAVGEMIAQSRDAMIKKLRDLIASGATARWTNFTQTAGGQLSDLLVKSFPASIQGFLDAGTTVMGADAVAYMNNLIASQLDPVLTDLINAALAVPPDPAQMNGSWAVTLVITAVDVPPGAQAEAKKQGCDIDFSKLVGQKIPAAIAIAVDDGGNGSATFTGKGSAPSKGPASYAGGKITMSFTANKATISMQGNAALTKSGPTMSGGFSMTGQGSPITMSGTWSGAKK